MSLFQMCVFFLIVRIICLFYFIFVKYLSSVLSLMFEHECLDTWCFKCLICMCFVFLYAQLSMFHLERRSRNTLIAYLLAVHCVSKHFAEDPEFDSHLRSGDFSGSSYSDDLKKKEKKKKKPSIGYPARCLAL